MFLKAFQFESCQDNQVKTSLHQNFNNIKLRKSENSVNKDDLKFIYLRKTNYKIENQKVEQSIEKIGPPICLIDSISSCKSGQVYEVVYKNN